MADGPRILVVDDEPDIRLALATYLEAALSAEVVQASGGDEGLAAMAAKPADLVMSDFRMPGMDGLQFLAACSQRWPDVPRLMMTAYADMQLAIRSVNETKVSRFITKPVQPEQLAATLRQILSESRRARQAAEALRRSAGAAKPRDG